MPRRPGVGPMSLRTLRQFIKKPVCVCKPALPFNLQCVFLVNQTVKCLEKSLKNGWLANDWMS